MTEINDFLRDPDNFRMFSREYLKLQLCATVEQLKWDLGWSWKKLTKKMGRKKSVKKRFVECEASLNDIADAMAAMRYEFLITAKKYDDLFDWRTLDPRIIVQYTSFALDEIRDEEHFEVANLILPGPLQVDIHWKTSEDLKDYSDSDSDCIDNSNGAYVIWPGDIDYVCYSSREVIDFIKSLL